MGTLHNIRDSLYNFVNGLGTAKDSRTANEYSFTELDRVQLETAYRSGGGTAIYRTCPLERRLRDVHALQQHFIVRSNTMTTAGAVLLGRDVDVPLF